MHCWGGPIEEIRPGDVVSIAPGEKHWHGVSPTTAMTHIAIQEYPDGRDAGGEVHLPDRGHTRDGDGYCDLSIPS